MELMAISKALIGKKHGYCEGCYRKADLSRVKVGNYAGLPTYKYLCKTCASLERLKKY